MNQTPTQSTVDDAVPVDDGAADHLTQAALPDVSLVATDGKLVRLSGLKGWWVIYAYPRTGLPGVPPPERWDAIAGARGCTPQACSFRDHHAQLQSLGANVLGLSAQSSDYQREARDRLQLPFEILSDEALLLKDALKLPTFSVAGMVLYRRLTMVCFDGVIRKVFYPVFPPDRNVADVLDWLKGQI